MCSIPDKLTFVVYLVVCFLVGIELEPSPKDIYAHSDSHGPYDVCWGVVLKSLVSIYADRGYVLCYLIVQASVYIVRSECLSVYLLKLRGVRLSCRLKGVPHGPNLVGCPQLGELGCDVHFGVLYHTGTQGPATE